MAENQFLTSVADVYLYDTSGTTETLIMNGKTLLNSSMTQSIQNQAINAGKGSQLIFEFSYQKELTFSIEDAKFSPAYICLQNNTKIHQAFADYYTTEFITLDSNGEGEVEFTPVGAIQIEELNGTYTPQYTNAKKFIRADLAGQEVQVVYAYEVMMDTIEIDAKSFPKAVKMVLNADIMTNNGLEEEMQITVPRFRPDGALELGMTHDGVSSSSLQGKSLADKKGKYAYINFKKVEGEEVQLSALATNPSEIELGALDTDGVLVNVFGIRGGQYSNILLNNADLTWTSDDSDIASVVNGLVTVGATGVTGNETVIRVTDGTYTDVITVEII